MFGPERIVLISDSMMACGMENGEYELGGQKVFMKDRKSNTGRRNHRRIRNLPVRLHEDCNVFRYSGSRCDFCKATRNPAKSIGVYDRVGSISVGKEADIFAGR